MRVWNAAGGGELHGFYAYHPGFTGGVHVGATDANIDGRSDIITGPGSGGGPHARIWSGATFAELTGLFPYDPRFTGGVFIG